MNISPTYPKVTVRELRGTTQTDPIEDNLRSIYVGPTERGSVFVPQKIQKTDELKRLFGTNSPLVDAVRSSLDSGVPQVSVQRVAQVQNESLDSLVIKEDVTGTVLAVYIVKTPYSSVDVFGFGNDMFIEFYNASGNIVSTHDVSLNRFKGNYIEDVDVPNLELYKSFQFTQKSYLGSNVTFSEESLDFSNADFTRPKTPWITSQDYPNYERTELFRFVIPQQGQLENQRIKVSITDIDDGTFTVYVREYEDSDFNPTILEIFKDLSLNPNEDNYIARIIGDRQKWFKGGQVNVSGQYEGLSKYVRVEMGTQPIPDALKPFGFQPYKPPVRSSTASVVPTVNFIETQKYGKIAQYANYGRSTLDDIFLGFDAENADNKQYLAGIPDQDQNPNSDFNIEDLNNSDVIKEQFTVAFQEGFVSVDESNEKKAFGLASSKTNLWGMDVSTKNSPGYESFQTAFDVLESQSSIEYKIVTIPDVRLEEHTLVVDLCEQFCKNQGTVFFPVAYLLPLDFKNQIESPREVVQSSFVGAYHGWIDIGGKIYPASNLVPLAYYNHDTSTQGQTSPSGMSTRIQKTRGLERKYSVSEQQQIMDVGANVVSDFEFGGVGFVGSQTLKSPSSALSELENRRVLNDISFDFQNKAISFLFAQTDSNIPKIEEFVNTTLRFYQDNRTLDRFRFEVKKVTQNGFVISTFLSFTGFVESIDIDFVIS